MTRDPNAMRWLPLAIFAALARAARRRRLAEPQARSRSPALAADRQAGAAFALPVLHEPGRTGHARRPARARRSCSTSGAAGARRAATSIRCSRASPRPSACASSASTGRTSTPTPCAGWSSSAIRTGWCVADHDRPLRARLGHLRRAGNLPRRRQRHRSAGSTSAPLTDDIIARRAAAGAGASTRSSAR